MRWCLLVGYIMTNITFMRESIRSCVYKSGEFGTLFYLINEAAQFHRSSFQNLDWSLGRRFHSRRTQLSFRRIEVSVESFFEFRFHSHESNLTTSLRQQAAE